VQAGIELAIAGFAVPRAVAKGLSIGYVHYMFWFFDIQTA